MLKLSSVLGAHEKIGVKSMEEFWLTSVTMLHVQKDLKSRAKMHAITLFYYAEILFNSFPALSCSCVMQQAAFRGCCILWMFPTTN